MLSIINGVSGGLGSRRKKEEGRRKKVEGNMKTIDERLVEAVGYAYGNASAVRARFEEVGLTPAGIETVADLEKLPLMPKDDLIALQQADPPFGGMLGVPLSELRHIFFSPGPLYEPDGVDDDDGGLRMVALALQKSGFVAGDVVLNTLSYHLVPAGLSLDKGLTMLGCTVVPGGVGNSDLQLKMMLDLGVTGYVGTASFLLSLIKKAEEQGLNFREQFKVTKAFVTAEPLPAPLRETLTGEYGISLGNGYGTAELGFLALGTTAGLAMQLLPEPIVEIVDPDTGKGVPAGAVGEVVATNFSRVYPLIRIGTGDMAVNVDPNPGHSTQAERAIMLVGRRGEAVKVRGMFVHPNQLRFAVAQLTQATGVQGVVSRPGTSDHFVVKVALADAGAASDELAAHLGGAIQQVCRVRVDGVEFVAGVPAGERGMVDKREW